MTQKAINPTFIQNITEWNQVPGTNTYFNNSDVRPEVTSDGKIKIYNARGESRSWGTPSVRSEVAPLTDEVIKVSVVGWHKHTVSPVGGDYYFVNEGGDWVRRTANHKVVKAALNS